MMRKFAQAGSRTERGLSGFNEAASEMMRKFPRRCAGRVGSGGFNEAASEMMRKYGDFEAHGLRRYSFNEAASEMMRKLSAAERSRHRSRRLQ